MPFEAHNELLRIFVAHRSDIVAGIQGLLNARQKAPRDRAEKDLLSQRFEDCFFALDALDEAQLALRGQLQRAHWSGGFKPREMPGLHNDLADAGEMMGRAFNLWQQTRRPGRNVLERYAQALFSLYLLRNLQLLVMRVWDGGSGEADSRLAQVQRLLDTLWQSAPPDQPVMLRDARWLIPVAQSPTTDELRPYFDVAAQLETSLAAEDRLEVHRATIALAGGHLRSQLRYYHMQGTRLDESSLVLSSRRSNALDFSMTIQGLVPLLDAYLQAREAGDAQRRLALAGAILQGISADPELFVNRLDLLGPYTMIEPLFTMIDGTGQAAYTPMGQRHLRLLQDYASRITDAAEGLHADCASFRPVAGAYSPYGVIYGFSSNITEHMALKTLAPEPPPPFSLEDAFTDGAAGSGKLEWVSGWRKLPHISKEVLAMYDYPQQFAELIFERIAQALRQRVEGGPDAAMTSGRLIIVPADAADANASQVPPLPLQYILSSDLQAVAGYRARSCDEASLLHDRFEGEFLVSYATAGGWIGISKDLLTDILGAGRDVKIAGLTPPVAGVLRLMCLGLTEPR